MLHKKTCQTVILPCRPVLDKYHMKEGRHGRSGLMETIDQYIQQGFGTFLAVYNGMSGHALSVWGYEYDEYGDYTGIWVSDSDDYSTDLKLVSVMLDPASNLWFLDSGNLYGYGGWFLGGVQALAEHTGANVPEPGTLLLLGFGLVWIVALNRKHRFFQRK